MALKDQKVIHDPVLGDIIVGRIEPDPDEPERIPINMNSGKLLLCNECGTRNGCICAWLEQEAEQAAKKGAERFAKNPRFKIPLF